MNEDDEREYSEWADRVHQDLVPKMEDSRVVLQLVPRGLTDIKFAVELGLSIMMDKPIIALVHRTTTPPAKLLAVADKVLVYDELEDVHSQLGAIIAELGG